MQVPNEVRTCVVFIGYRTASNLYLAGTGFLMLVPVPGTPRLGGYVVTAKHVIDGIKKKMPIDGKVLLRLNQKSAGAIVVDTDISVWIEHPDSTADVAILPIGLQGPDWDHGFIGIEMAVTPDIIQKRAISLGDEVFLTGLFIPHSGLNRNIPIVRIGNIACMPEEPVKTLDYGLIDAYLIEARSIGGLSGSPVFVVTGGPGRQVGNTIELGAPFQYHLLGLMHGHWDAPTSASGLIEDEKVNMGIAVVVPASRIIEALHLKDAMIHRENLRSQYLAAMSPTPDSEPSDQ